MDRNTVIRRARLISGLILFAFVSTHLINHSLGIISIEAMEAGADYFLAFWRNPVVTAVFVGAFLIHLGLALRTLFLLRTIRLPVWHLAQITLGIAIPFLLIGHVVPTRFAHELTGAPATYTHELLILWVDFPDLALKQWIFMLIVWSHACIGLQYVLRLKSWFRRWMFPIFALAILIPAAASAGYLRAGLDIMELASDPAVLAEVRALIQFPEDAAWESLVTTADILLYTYLGLLALTVILRGTRWLGDRRRARCKVTYQPGGKAITVIPGASVLETSRSSGIEHASVCGGRGRCSTCRVRINDGLDACPPATAGEAAVLERIGAPPNVRLACQLRPTAPVDLTLLMPPHTKPSDLTSDSGGHGREIEIAVLFADLRGFTSMSEHKLPYDIVFILNKYFRLMGEAIESSGGYLDKFIGDGIMALFGVEDGPVKGSQKALAAAAGMAKALEEINQSLAHDLDAPLRIGIGIHCGPAIVGQMGHGSAFQLTAIGDTVNTASRLESMTKEKGVVLIVSAEAEARAGVALDTFPSDEVMIRGRTTPMPIRLIDDPASLDISRKLSTDKAA